MRFRVSRWVLAAGLSMAGSCTPTGGPEAGPPPAADEQTLAFGYAAIAARHLQPVTAATAALDGLRGLGRIDPGIGVARRGDWVELAAAGRVVGEYPAPAADDARGWAHLTVTVAEDARDRSPALAAADPEWIIQAVFDATLARLDRFSRYAGPREAARHRAARDGCGGIGLTAIPAGSGARVAAVQDHTPAAAAGITVGDLLTEVDDRPVAGLDRDDLAARLGGPVASDLAVTVQAAGGPARRLTLRRALVVPETITGAVRDGIAEFHVAGFNQHTAADLGLRLEAARRRPGPGLKGVVLDLRGNPGGLLDQAVAVADLFIAHGPIVSTRGRHPLASQSYAAHDGDVAEDLPVVVLVDGGSASAAEIVAAALEDSGRAVVVGTNSFGKGTVQTVLRLPNDGEMTLTWSRFYTPSGYALHHLGVPPEICTADLSASPAALVDGATRASAARPLAAHLAEWRAAGLDDTARRRRLRAACPAGRHGDARLDMAVAERLLGNPDAYREVLVAATPPAAAVVSTAASP